MVLALHVDVPAAVVVNVVVGGHPKMATVPLTDHPEMAAASVVRIHPRMAAVIVDISSL